MEKKKKKKSKKDEEMERLLREEEAERERLEAERKAKMDKERRERAAKMERERREQEKRDLCLAAGVAAFREMAAEKLASDVSNREQRQWKRYLACDGLPAVESVKEMNTHLYLWETDSSSVTSVETVLHKVEEVLDLLEPLEELIQDPLDAPKPLQDNWKEVRTNYRRVLKNQIDMATFYTLRDIKGKMNRTDYYNATLRANSERVSLGMWTWLQVPVASTEARRPPFVEFPSLGVSTQLPKPFQKEFTVVRLARFNFNHYNDRCRSYEMVVLPNEYLSMDLYQLTKKRWNDIELLRMKVQEEAKPKVTKKQWWGKDFDFTEVPADAMEKTEDNAKPILQSVEDSGGEEEKKQGEKEEAEESRHEGSIEMDPEVSPQVNLDDVEETEVEIVDSPSKTSLPSQIVPLESPSQSGEQVNIFPMDQLDENQAALWKVFLAMTEMGEKVPRELIKKLKPLDLNTLIEMYEIREYEIYSETPSILDLKRRKSKSITTVKKSPKRGQKMDGRKSHDDFEAFRTPSEILKDNEEEAWKEMTRLLAMRLDKGELNMRSHNVIGGVFLVDLIIQPPQDYIDPFLNRLTILYGEPGLVHREFSYVYTAPVIETEKEGESEGGEGGGGSKKGEGELDNLVSVNIILPPDVLWFDPPKPVLWREEESHWSERDVYDSKYNEDKQTLTFRVGRIAPMGLSIYRFSNLPFQTWELKPLGEEDTDDVFFTITCNTVIVEFIVRDDQVKLRKLQNVTGTAMESVVDKWMSPRELVRKLRLKGLDIFPEADAYLYVEGASAKHPQAEDHLYHCMALASLAYGFTWSRWNLLAGRDSMVVQMRELRAKNQVQLNYSTLLVKPDRAIIVDCNEVSPSFTERGVEGMGFYPDLHTLISETGSIMAKACIEDVQIDLVETLYFLLGATKVLSYS